MLFFGIPSAVIMALIRLSWHCSAEGVSSFFPPSANMQHTFRAKGINYMKQAIAGEPKIDYICIIPKPYMKRLLLAVLLIAVVSCGPKWKASEADGYTVITQKGGPVLGYTSSPILQDHGFAFKDLNRNGVLDPYEDWRLPAENRAKDLASRLSVEEIAGLMLYSSHQAVPGSAYGFGAASYSDPEH